MALTNQMTVDEEMRKNPELTREMIEELKEWISTQPHLPQNIPEIDLVFFLHSCFFKVENAKQTLENYYTIRTLAKEIFNDRDPRQEILIEAANVVSYIYLPDRTPNGERVAFSRFLNFDPSKYVIEHACKVSMNMMDVELHQNGTTNGEISVMDMKGMTLGHFLKFNFTLFKHFNKYLQEGLPMRLVASHVINANSLMYRFYSVIRPLLGEEMERKVKIHSENSIEEFYKYIPKEILPSDYGGNAPSWEELHKKALENICNNHEFIIEEEKMRVDESLRPAKPSFWRFWS